MKNEVVLRVPYADTDQMGMVYYANYLIYFERGRTELLRDLGLAYRDLEAKGIYIPVIEASCNYISPARYDDELMVLTTVSSLGAASIEFSYEILKGGKRITTGKTRHPIVNKEFRPMRMPEEIKKVFDTVNTSKTERIDETKG